MQTATGSCQSPGHRSRPHVSPGPSRRPGRIAPCSWLRARSAAGLPTPALQVSATPCRRSSRTTPPSPAGSRAYRLSRAAWATQSRLHSHSAQSCNRPRSRPRPRSPGSNQPPRCLPKNGKAFVRSAVPSKTRFPISQCSPQRHFNPFAASNPCSDFRYFPAPEEPLFNPAPSPRRFNFNDVRQMPLTICAWMTFP